MIKVNGVTVEPTRFPDTTTQVWKLPQEVLDAAKIHVDWRFEREDEFFTLAQLRALFASRPFSLHVPYLPYARQDKVVGNDRTFALFPFAALLNSMELDEITAVDVHNPDLTKTIIDNFRNVVPDAIHHALIAKLNPDMLLFPDEGAKTRYSYLFDARPHLVFEKYRHQGSGQLQNHQLRTDVGSPFMLSDGMKLLIVDDICDGGATFLSIAKSLRAKAKTDLHLFVTHGIFSKGREVLTNEGITLHTTNSLPRNVEGIPV